MVRGVDRLDPLPDAKICEQDQAYLQQHQIGALFSQLMLDVMCHAPADPVQFMIDSLTLGAEDAMQAGVLAVPARGLPAWWQAAFLFFQREQLD